MFWFKPFRNFLRKFTIFRNFDQWSEILSMSDGRPSSQGVCPSSGLPIIRVELEPRPSRQVLIQGASGIDASLLKQYKPP